MKPRTKEITAIVLAAGEGTRMRSRHPKVLQALAGYPMLLWVLRVARWVGAHRRIVVVGCTAEQVKAALPADVLTARQARPLGTGHALQAAEKLLHRQSGDVLVLCGDTPLLHTNTLRRLIQQHRRLQAQATVLTARLASPQGYGRILREPDHPHLIARIVEEPEATAKERECLEVNSGVYCFALPLLWKFLHQIQKRNRKKEYYLTDIVHLLRAQGHKVAAVMAEEASEIMGINTQQDFALAAKVLNQRLLHSFMQRGITILDPDSTWIDADVRIGPNTCLLPGTHLKGRTSLGPDNRIGPQTYLESTRTGANVCITYSVLEQAHIGDRVTIGPFAHLRPGVKVDSDVRIGNFVEVNRSRIQHGVKMGHVGYLGDAIVGPNANIGAGAITANYNGQQKNQTRIGAAAFIGSGAVLVAPTQIGRQALIGAGAVVKARSRIPAGSVAVGVPARVIKKRSC